MMNGTARIHAVSSGIMLMGFSVFKKIGHYK